MTDNVENIVLEHLRAIRADIGAIRHDIADMKLRLGSLEEHVAGLRRDIWFAAFGHRSDTQTT